MVDGLLEFWHAVRWVFICPADKYVFKVCFTKSFVWTTFNPLSNRVDFQLLCEEQFGELVTSSIQSAEKILA